MWLPPDKSPRPGRRFVFAALVAVMASGVGACNFRPMYGVSPAGTDVTAELAYVAVPERRDRLGQLIRNRLLSTMSPAGGPLGDRYVLDFKPVVSTSRLAIEPDGDVSRRLYKLAVEYRLTDTQTKKVVHSGRTFTHLAYTRVRSEFAQYPG